MRLPRAMGCLIGAAQVLLCLSCGRFGFEPLDGSGAAAEPDAATATDAAVDDGSQATTCGPFALDLQPLSELYGTPFFSRSGAGFFYSDGGVLWQATVDSEGAITVASQLDGTDLPGSAELAPTLTGDERRLVFNQTSPLRLVEMSRASLAESFAGETELPFSPGSLWDPELSSDGLTLIFAADWDDAGNLFMAERDSLSSGFRDPVDLSQLNSPQLDGAPSVTPDGLTLVFASERAGNIDLYFAERATPGGDFSSLRPLTALNSGARDDDPALSADGETLLFNSDRSGSIETYRATRSCE